MKAYISDFFIDTKNAFLFSFPLILFQLLNTLSSYGIAIIIARLGIEFAAAYSIINSIIMTISICAFGMLSAVSICLSHKSGANDYAGMQKIFSTNFYLATFLSLSIICLFLALPTFLKKLSQSELIVLIVQEYFTIFTFGILPYFWGMLLLQILVAAKKTKLSFYSNIFRFIFTCGFVFIFVEGFLRFKPLGLKGASMAIVLVNWTLLPILMLFVSKAKFPIKVKKCLGYFNFSILLKSLKISIPITIAVAVEIILHMINSIYSGQLGLIQQAIYLLFLQSVVAIVVVPFAISQCVSVSTGYSFGANNFREIIKTLLSNLFMSLIVVIFICSLFLIFSEEIIELFYPQYVNMPVIYQKDIQFIIKITVGLLIIETIRLVVVGTLRGIQDVNIPLFINILSFLVIGVFVSQYFAFDLDLQVRGLVLGELIAVTCSTFLLILRFLYALNKNFAGNLLPLSIVDKERINDV